MVQAVGQSISAATSDSSLWTACVEEMPERGWLLELESAQLYLTVSLSTPTVLSDAVEFLRTALIQRKRPKFHPGSDEFFLGHFGQIPVSLLRDDEDFVRCFLLIGPRDSCALRVSLDEAAVAALADAISLV